MIRRAFFAFGLIATAAVPVHADPCFRSLGKDIKGTLTALAPLATGGALAFGHGTGPRRPFADLWLVELDGAGAAVRDVFVPRRGEDKAVSLARLPDGDVLLGGDAPQPGTHGFMPLLVRVDPAGKERWARTFDAAGFGTVHAIAPLPDGGLALALSRSKKKGGLAQDGWALRADKDGKRVWDHVVTGDGVSGLMAVSARADGSLVFAGWTTSRGAGESDGLLIALGADGARVWEQTYGGPRTDTFRRLVPLSDGGFLCGGSTLSKGDGTHDDFWIVRTDASGVMAWERSFGGAGRDFLWDVVPTADGGFLLAGTRQPAEGGYSDVWLVRVDGTGAELWQRVHEGPIGEQAKAGIALADGGFLFVGSADEDEKSTPFSLRVDSAGACVGP